MSETVQTQEEQFQNAEKFLQEIWEDCMDDFPRNVARAHTAIAAYQLVEIFQKRDSELWLRRLSVCPEKDNHQDSRIWCAYCGDLPAGGEA